MLIEDFFNWLGHALGSLVRFIVDGLSGFFNLLSQAGSSFLQGMAEALGTDASLLSLFVLIPGLWLLYAAFRAGLRKAFTRMVLYALLGLWLLSLLVA